MTIKVLVSDIDDDRELVDWVIKNCDGFLYSVSTDNGYDGLLNTELFFATEQDAVIFNLRYF